VLVVSIAQGPRIKMWTMVFAVLLFAFVLGRLFEPLLRQGLILSYGDPMAFLASPLSARFLAAAALIVLWPLLAARFR
jgi:putative tricarboxylic transport membrane protein